MQLQASATKPLTYMVASGQLAAMGGSAFELGVLRADGTMLLRAPVESRFVARALAWLRHENACGGHIFVRPAGLSPLILVDDLGAEAVALMKRTGFEPAALVETSPGNFQAWLKHERPLDREIAREAARALAERFGGDPSSASWRHFGRLAGFTNQKPSRRLASGRAPFVLLREAPGGTFSAAALLRGEAERRVEQMRSARASWLRNVSLPVRGPGRSLLEFHRDPRYVGDLHRADLAWAASAALRGVSADEIKAALLAGRDLSKKGSMTRQLAYVERTVLKAMVISMAAHRPRGGVTCR
jgi:hypothetical protein